MTLEERFWARVEKTQTCWVWTGKSRNGYGQVYCGGGRQHPKMVSAHRLSYELPVGKIPDDLELDHLCHNRSCVNPSHLRIATRKENLENPAGLRVDNTSGARGVYWVEHSQKWMAKVGHHGERIYLGLFDTREDAAAAAKEKRLELFTHNELDRRAG